MPNQGTINLGIKTKSSLKSYEVPGFPTTDPKKDPARFYSELAQSWYDLKSRILELEAINETNIEQINNFIASGAIASGGSGGGGGAPTPHNHDDLYYRQIQLDEGQLDNRYYTETEVNNLLKATNLKFMYNAAYNTNHREFTFVGKQNTRVDVWDTVSKTTALFSNVLTYTGKQLTQTVLTNIVTGETLTSTYAYDGKKLDTVDEVFA